MKPSLISPAPFTKMLDFLFYLWYYHPKNIYNLTWENMGMWKRLKVSIVLLIIIYFSGNFGVFGQEIDRAQLQEKEAPAIRCWLKSDKSSVRIGETFVLTLTCQVAETEYEKVVPQENGLEPAVVSFSPYEVVEGWRMPDINRGTFRFLQYRYKLRLIGEEFFGKEVPTQKLEIKYRVERKLNEDEVLDTRERTYILPAMTIKVSSVVPEDAEDIRDFGDGSFQTVKTRRQKAYMALIVAGVVSLLPFLVLLMPAVRSVRNWRKTRSNGTGFSNSALLRRIKGELNKVKRVRDKEGWNGELVGRILTIIRVMGAIATSKQINQLPTRFESRGLEGQLKLRKGLIWPRKVLISSNITPESLVLNHKIDGEFSSVFMALNDIRYGSVKDYDQKYLDDLFYKTMFFLAKIKFLNRWLVKKWLSLSVAVKEWRPAWHHS